MAKEPPGLDHEPPPDALTGFSSLMPPPPPKKPGPIGKLVRLPFRLVGLPFRLVGKLAGGRGRDDTADDER